MFSPDTIFLRPKLPIISTSVSVELNSGFFLLDKNKVSFPVTILEPT